MYFSVDCKPVFTYNDYYDCCAYFDLALDDKWSLKIILIRNSPYEKAIINSIQIHRRNNAGESLISGNLKLSADGKEIWNKALSQSIRNGSSFTEIGSILNHYAYINKPVYRLFGHLNIADNGEKCVNDVSDKRFQLKSLEELSKDFKRLLDPSTSCFSDVVLKCDGASIAAHKNILSARSPVFAAMFSNPMKESHKNEVDVTDIGESVLRAMLVYMYTGKCGDLTVSSAADLLFAADKYHLQDLKRICCDALKDSVSPQNVLRILVLGDLHSSDLKTSAMGYISKQHAEFAVIEKTEEWKALQNERPGLVIEVLTSLAHSMNKKLLG